MQPSQLSNGLFSSGILADPIKERHRSLWAVDQQNFNGFGRPLHRRKDKRFFQRSKGLEEEIRRVLPAKRATNANLDPREILIPQRRNQRGDAAVASGSSASGLDPYAAERQ